MAKNSARPLVATLVRGDQVVGRPRYFVRLSTALRRTVELLVLEGQPGDIVELAHNELGFQIGFVRIHTAGRMDIDFTPLMAHRHLLE